VAVELHLPDLPEVPISLGPVAGSPTPRRRRHRPWGRWVREALSTYLPLLLMALLALSTWWLVKNTPTVSPAPESSTLRREPDYMMTQFAIERFDREGRLRVRVDGERMRHFPDTDRYEIDRAHIRALAPDGQVTVAVAERALANGDLSELQLHGGARVTSSPPQGQPLDMRSEFLHADLVRERVRTHLPVWVSDGHNTLQAAGLEYDHGRRALQLEGRLRAQLVAPSNGGKR
jgi:lipopolysaccharide export system protein LptC